MKKYLIFDVGGTFIKWAIINDNYQILENSKFAFDSKNLGAKKMLEQIGKYIFKIQKNHNIDAIGISTAGIVDSQTTKILGSCLNIKDYKNIVLKDEIKKYINVPIVVENDANAAAIGESLNPNLKSFSNILLLTLGTDIGGGIILNNKIYHGGSMIAGEIGYLIVDDKRWGDYYSSNGLMRLVRENNEQDLSTHQILESNDHEIQKSLDYWYHGIAKGIANIQFMMNFEAIIIGGGISESKLFDLNKIRKYIDQILYEQIFIESYQLFKASYGNNAAIIGMAKLINDQIN